MSILSTSSIWLSSFATSSWKGDFAPLLGQSLTSWHLYNGLQHFPENVHFPKPSHSHGALLGLRFYKYLILISSITVLKFWPLLLSQKSCVKIARIIIKLWGKFPSTIVLQTTQYYISIPIYHLFLLKRSIFWYSLITNSR
jgi:hypothetical protein